MANFKKVVRLGTVKRYYWFAQGRGHETDCNVYCKIELTDGKLSISGVEGPKRNGDAIGSCGQIDMHLRGEQDSITCAPGWDADKLARFFDVWDMYHLNNMQGGTPKQMAWLKEHRADYDAYMKRPRDKYDHGSHYDWASTALAAYGLNPADDGEHVCKPDKVQRYVHEVGEHTCLKCGKAKGYKYGSAWLKIEVPADVVEFLQSLPDTDIKPAWV